MKRGPALLAVCLCGLLVASSYSQQNPQNIVVVAQDGSGDIQGDTEQPIVEAIRRMVEAGGGTVRIKEGAYIIHDTIGFGPDVHDLVIEGAGEVVLKLAPQIRTTAAAELKPGDARMIVADASAFKPNMQIEIQAEGRKDSFSGYQTKSFSMRVKSVEGSEIEFTGPTKYGAPAGTNVVQLVNLFQMDRAKRLTLRGLTLDGDMKKEDMRPISHVFHCGVFGQGPYTYEKGPTGPPVEDITIENCIIRNFFHRGIALYSVVRPTVLNCTVENTMAEAVDFDHFCTHCVARGNNLSRAPVGVEMNDASYCLIEGNTIRECGVGVNIWQWCKLDNLNVENKIVGNTILDTKNTAIRCAKGADRNLIEGNTIKGGAAVGIVLQGADNIARKNTITDLGKEAMLVQGTGNQTEENVVTNCKEPAKK
ncbi:MAG: right-handed parallel beta-helix repeat-containing protein [Planctomycetota bacterium]